MSDQTNVTSNTTFLPLSEQLGAFGFHYLVDILVTIFYIPSCFLGSLLSLVCILVFCSSDFKLPMFIYLRMYSLANTAIALVSIYSALTTPIQLISWANSSAANFYVAYVYCPIMNLSYFFATMIDIAMLMDRIALFVPRLKPLACNHPYKLSALVFVYCLAVDFPYFFFYLPTSVLFQLNETDYYRLYYIDYTEFGFSQAGHVIQYTQWVVRDILPVVAIFICGLVSVTLLKAHMNKKHTILNPRQNKKGKINPESSSVTNKDNANEKNDRVSRSNVRFSLLVHLVSVLTTIQSVFSILALASILFYPASIFVTIANNVFNFFLVFKCCCLFFIFYFLNTNFKKKINSWTCLKCLAKKS